ncbi:MAG TPA: alpha/beta hydrolase [Myxococcales bacterium]|nr:alpha/beta hydrolase [Myxococcales bacterium]
MPFLNCPDGTKLHYEEAGAGQPIVFVHEFLGDIAAWEPQLRYFSRRYRCIAFNARGYPPSDVPQRVEEYSYEQQRAGILAVLDGLGLAHAHIVGLSMGAFASFYFGMKWPRRALSLTLAGIGSGSEARSQFRAESEAAAEGLLRDGWPACVEARTLTPTRVQYRNKDPRGFAEFVARVTQHSAQGSALTLKGYQALRPSLSGFAEEMAASTVPTLILCGDEDEPCLDVSLMLKRGMPAASLMLFPRTGHAVNLEEPDLFNLACERFFHQVESGQYGMRDPLARTAKMI